LNRIVYIVVFIFFLGHARAQELLTIESAIKIALENNFDVKIYRDNEKIAKLQNNLGNAGMSPTVSLNANAGYSNLDSHQEFSSGTTQDRTGAVTTNGGASANVGWIIFDGMKMFAVKKRLQVNEEVSSVALKKQMETLVYNVILNYYDLVRMTQLIKAQEINISLYTERRKIAELKHQTGSDSKVDLLMTEIDESKAKNDLLQLENQRLIAAVKLNELLARSADLKIETADTIPFVFEPSEEDLKKFIEKNTSVKQSRLNVQLAEQMMNESRSAYLPQVQLNGSYNFTRLKSEAGFLFKNQQNGIALGVTAGWTIFNGSKNSRLVKERQIQLLDKKWLEEQVKQQVSAISYINYRIFLSTKKISENEKENLKKAGELYFISMERFKIGKTGLLETKEAHKSLEETKVRLINSNYALKKAETELLLSSGDLVK